MVHGNQVLRHLQRRKRMRVRLGPYLHSEKGQRMVDKLVYLAAFVGLVMTLPQIAKIWVEKNAAGVSAASWATYTVLSIFWLIYGIAYKERPIIFSSSLWIILDAFIVLGTLIYG